MSHDCEIILIETKKVRSNIHAEANYGVKLNIKKEKVDIPLPINISIKQEKVDNPLPVNISIKEERVDADIELIKISKNLNNSNYIPLLNEQQLRIKKEKNDDDLELLSIEIGKNENNPYPVPLLNEVQLKIKEENAKRKRCLEELQKVSTLIESSDFSCTSKKQVIKGLKPMKKKVVESNIKNKSIELRRLVPKFKTLYEKELALATNLKKMVYTLENADEEDKLSNFDEFLSEFQTLWATLPNAPEEDCSQLSKRPRNNDIQHAEINQTQDIDTIRPIKEQYLPLLKNRLNKYNIEVKNCKDCLKEIEQSKKFKNDVWKQYNSLLKWEGFIKSKLEI